MRLLRSCLWLLLLSPATAAMAQAGIHRCVGATGNLVFTDRACTDVQATPAPPTTTAPVRGLADDGSGVPPPILCAANLTELKQGVADAFAARDANRLAGLMLWDGDGHDTVLADIRSLHALVQHPLVDLGEASDDPADVSPPADASLGTTAAPGAATTERGAASELRVRTAAGDGSDLPRETRFSVVRRAGCLWLRRP